MRTSHAIQASLQKQRQHTPFGLLPSTFCQLSHLPPILLLVICLTPVADGETTHIKNAHFSKDASGPFVTFDLLGPITNADQSDRFTLQVFFNRDAPIPTGDAGTDLNAADFQNTCGVPSYY